MFLLPITRFFSNLFEHPSLVKKRHQIPMNEWSATSRAKFYLLKMKMLAAVDCNVMGVALKISGFLQRDAGRRVFAARLIVKGGVVE